MARAANRPSRRRGGGRRKAVTAPPPRQAVLYARVSSREQEREGFSIPAQRSLLQSYATDNGLTIVQEFVDIETAKATGRIEFGKMLKYLKRRVKAPVILVEKTDRLYRNLKDWVALDDMDVDVHLVKEGIVLSDDSRSSEKFVHGIKVLMAKNYVDNLSEEVRKGMHQKAAQGHWPGAAPLGYLNRREGGKSLIVPDPERAPLIRSAFEMYDTGDFSIKAIADFAHRNGYRGKRGGKIATGTMHLALRNPLYAGHFYWGGREYEGSDPTLISWELYKRVQDRLDGHTYTRAVERQFAYSGLVTCGHCGGAITAELKKKKYIYYHCATRCQREKFVREEQLEKMFLEAMQALVMPEHVRNETIAVLKTSRRDIAAETDRRLAEARARYDRLGRLINGAYEDKLEGRIDLAFFTAKRTEWEGLRSEAQAEMERLANASAKNMDMAISVFELANSAYDLLSRREPQEQRRLLEILLSNSELANGEFTVTFRKPFCYLASWNDDPNDEGPSGGDSGGAHSEWSGWPDSNRRPPVPQTGARPYCATPRCHCESRREDSNLLQAGYEPTPFPSGSPRSGGAGTRTQAARVQSPGAGPPLPSVVSRNGRGDWTRTSVYLLPKQAGQPLPYTPLR